MDDEADNYPVKYVERDEFGVIKGVYENPQPDIPEEALPADDPQITAFFALRR